MVKQYLDHSLEILTSKESEFKANKRTGIGHISLVGYQNKYDLREGFPLLTTKRVPFKMVAHELIWFLKGETNIKYLVNNNVSIWDDNAFTYNLEKMADEGVIKEAYTKHSPGWFDAKKYYIERIKEDEEFADRWGDLGPVYGSQWIHWPEFVKDENQPGLYRKDPNGIDQIARTIEGLQKNTTAKRYVVSAWNPNEVPNMALPPCHTFFHVTSNGEDMDLHLYQRSCDMLLGVPFNIASYAMLTQIIAQQAGLKPRRFIHTFGDVHFYCGAGERAEWYRDNLDSFKDSLKLSAESKDGYKNMLEKLNSKLPPELEGKEGQDHVTGILKQLSRIPKELPKVTIADKHYSELTIDDFKLEGYDPEPPIKRAIAV